MTGEREDSSKDKGAAVSNELRDEMARIIHEHRWDVRTSSVGMDDPLRLADAVLVPIRARAHTVREKIKALRIDGIPDDAQEQAYFDGVNWTVNNVLRLFGDLFSEGNE